MSAKVLLKMTNVHKKFPGVYALRDVQLELLQGEVHAILGENGAGKSTLIKVLGGIYPADQGEIEIEGCPVEIHTVHDAQQNGIAIIHQELVLVPHMTVAENIYLGREPMHLGFVDQDKMIRDAQALLDTYEMNIQADSLVGRLTIAQQQMVEIVKAISYHSKILVMDEPTSSISDKEVGFLFNTIRNLTQQGVGVIYISHKMRELDDICDRVTVLRDGMYIGTETVRETTKDRLISMMVGRELTQYYIRDGKAEPEEVLRVEHLSDGHMVKDVSFTLHKGEILGFAGLVGAGRSEAMKCIFGLTPHYTGELYLEGQKIRIDNPVKATQQGIALVPENRKEEGLYKVQSVCYNSTIEVLQSFIRGLVYKPSKEESIARHYIDMMRTKTPSLEQTIGNLSGGNQQKVMIGRWLATMPKVLILDEPTRGVDVGAKSEIYAMINDLTKQGVSILMISSELPEVINMSDRIYVMADGRTKGCLQGDEITQERIMQLAAE
ncbi:MAG: sugar ABC transporter ATP-binding protein [Candidatus Limiplasma sp.]|nr:sugar ABC transporter ATP-binding protein [Candidatus Limiplasma sp.]